MSLFTPPQSSHDIFKRLIPVRVFLNLINFSQYSNIHEFLKKNLYEVFHNFKVDKKLSCTKFIWKNYISCAFASNTLDTILPTHPHLVIPWLAKLYVNLKTWLNAYRKQKKKARDRERETNPARKRYARKPGLR